MSVSEQYRLARRDKVLLAARKCFIRHGFHATGMAEIAKSCRMSVGNIYRYFPHKSAIVQAIADETRSQLFPALRSLENQTDPIEGLIEILLFSVRQLRRDSNARLWMEILAEAPRNRTIRTICFTFDKEFRQILERLMQRAVQAARMSPNTNLEAASLWLIALLDGAIARLSAEPDLDIDRTLDTLAHSIRRSLCVG